MDGARARWGRRRTRRCGEGEGSRTGGGVDGRDGVGAVGKEDAGLVPDVVEVSEGVVGAADAHLAGGGGVVQRTFK